MRRRMSYTILKTSPQANDSYKHDDDCQYAFYVLIFVNSNSKYTFSFDTF